MPSGCVPCVPGWAVSAGKVSQAIILEWSCESVFYEEAVQKHQVEGRRRGLRRGVRQAHAISHFLALSSSFFASWVPWKFSETCKAFSKLAFARALSPDSRLTEPR